MVRVGITTRVWRNNLPNLARSLGIGVDEELWETGEVIREVWSDDVRVSDGPGNFVAGGEHSHYRDEIYVEKITKNTVRVSTPVDYAIWNEYGSVTISPKPSMAKGKAAGDAYLRDRLTQLILSQALGGRL